MHSNFAAARLFLERAFVALRGNDEFSIKAREALALLIGACAAKEFFHNSPDANHTPDASGTNVDRSNLMHVPSRADHEF